MPVSTPPKALAFDVFGTVVDWRRSIAREVAPFLASIGRTDISPERFADGWRERYVPATDSVRSGRRPFVVLDVLHREMLEDLLQHHGVNPAGLGDQLLDELTRAWHRLDPWPDAVEGLIRLKRQFPLVTLSNGNIALMLALARRSGLPWDAILGAEFSRTYKPDPGAYLGTVEALGLEPSQVCLVAAHHGDLVGARACGLQTAFVARPMEYGGRRAPDADLVQDWEHSARDLLDLADQLGC